MVEPFSPEVATRLIHDRPGRTAAEIVKDALSHRVIGSRGKDPVQGQMGALVKMYLHGRLPQVWRDESQRPFRYYSSEHQSTVRDRTPGVAGAGRSVGQPARADTVSQVISFRPTPWQDRVIGALVGVGVAASRTEAVQWLLEQGISARSEFVERALATQAQIEELRRGMQSGDR
jgi:hypothetical protein